jgi:3'(2'), 5'-bisphosphate nucleotidase
MRDYLKGYEVADIVSIGSSLKFCLLAQGRADLYPRLGTTMEWDTAAGHAVLLAAGGAVVAAGGGPLLYGKPGFSNPWFVAAGSVAPLPLA